MKLRSPIILIFASGILAIAGLLLGTFLTQEDLAPPPSGMNEGSLPAGIEKFQKLDDNLYRGAQPGAKGFKELEKLGVRTVVNLRTGHSDEEALAGTSLAYRNIGMNVWDIDEPDVIAFLKLVSDRSKGPFFVHCEHGVDRTGFMCAIYRIVVQGWSKEKALKERRAFKPHLIWKNLERYIRKMDVHEIRRKARL